MKLNNLFSPTFLLLFSLQPYQMPKIGILFGQMSLTQTDQLMKTNGFIRRNYPTVTVGIIMKYNITLMK